MGDSDGTGAGDLVSAMVASFAALGAEDRQALLDQIRAETNLLSSRSEDQVTFGERIIARLRRFVGKAGETA